MQSINDTNKETTPSTSNLVPLYPVMAYQFTPPTSASNNSSAFVPVNTNPDAVPYSIQVQEKTPLLESQQQPKGGITYQINHHYHPKQAVKYAKQRPVCCCLTLLCMCCCLLFVVGGIVGAIFGVYALQCVNLSAVQTTSYNTTMSANITSISINSDIGDISVTYDGTIGDDIVITITKYASQDSEANLFDDTFDVVDGQVYFSESTNKPAGLKAVFGCLRSDIEISLPYEMPSKVALNIQSENGNIKFTGLNPTMNSWTSANIQTTNGNIDVSNNLVGSIVSLVTKNGNINVANVYTGDITMTTVNGNVDAAVYLNTSTCSLHASSVNGNLDVNPTFNCVSTKVSMDTVNGNIDSTVVGYSGNFDLEATNGKVTIDTQPPVSVTYTTNSSKDKEGAFSGYSSAGTCALSTINGNVKSEFN